VVEEVDLGGVARALGEHHVETGAEVGEALEDGSQKTRLPGVVLGRGQVADGTALDDDLAGPLARGLEENGVHGHFGLHAGGHGLHSLGPADLLA
jgi:hypothetical protein